MNRSTLIVASIASLVAGYFLYRRAVAKTPAPTPIARELPSHLTADPRPMGINDETGQPLYYIQ
jgi:hypothetical protein